MAARMNSPSRALRLIISATVLPLLAVPFFASGATVRKAQVVGTASRPVVANNTIIPLPLMPVVPAAQRLCAVRTPSGLGYTMLRAASGPKPGGNDTVLVNYIGYLAATGAVFDQGMQTPLTVDGVIPGFSQALQMIGRKGIARICIPAAMGYGAQASGPVPANSDLVFQVELLDFKTAAEIEDLRKAEATGAAPPKDAVPQP
jgi:FKBP-type peptidyl-prolyl cis-trans isomerase FkpA